ncbi:MAG TPA: CotH kinase family protein [Vicinamibacterales bacterium]
MSRPRVVAAALVAIALAAPSLWPVSAQTTADPFDDTTLHDVRLFVNSRDLAQLRARYTENINTPADIQIDGTRVRNVAIRSRGLGSRRPDKLGLRVDFNFYVPGRSFRGHEALVLDNLWQDEALIREQLAMKVFRRMGEPAPRESFCRLFINNQYHGLYSLVEEIDPDFAARETGLSNGYLFEYHWHFPFYGEDLGEGLDIYKALLEPRSHQLESDETLYGPFRDLFRDMNTPDDALWFELVSPRLDLPQFLRMLAIETSVGDADAILGYAGMNNFYVFRPGGSGPHRLFPWDRDLSFRFDTTSILRGLEENIIFRRAYANPDLRTGYFDTIEAAAHLMMDENWLELEIDRMVALIDTAAREDTLKQFTNEQYDDQLAFIRNFAQTRPTLMIEEVARLR